MSAKHSLTAKDKAALTATCSICGPAAKIAKNGKYGFVCVIGRRQAIKRWRQAHPERARKGRKSPHSKHWLTNRNGLPDTCSACGPVEVKAWGRGWICANLLAEKKWTATQTEPAPKCQNCNKVWLIDGLCPRCDEQDRFRSLPDWLEQDIRENGMHVETTEWPLPDDIESAVHGWKTLGSLDREPPKVRPEYAALFGSGGSLSPVGSL